MKVYKALINLQKNSPSLFILLNKVKIKSCKKTETAYCFFNKDNNFFEIVINENWIESFNEYNLSAIIEHELLHIVLNHCTDYTQFKDRKALNIAMDCIINDISVFIKNRKKLNDELKNGIFLENINKELCTDFKTEKNTCKDIYYELLKNKEILDDINQFDEGMTGDTTQDDNSSESMPRDILEKLIGPENLEKISNDIGDKCADLNIFNSEKLKKQKNAKILNGIKKFFASNKIDSKKTIKKLNRRFNFLPYGKQKADKQKVLLGIDLSGSMLNENTLEKIKMSIGVAINNDFEIDLIFGDTQKQGFFKNVKKNFDLKNLKGGGGTKLDFIFENSKIYDCIVLVTDSYFNEIDLPQNRKNILCLNTEKNKCFNLKTINI